MNLIGKPLELIPRITKLDLDKKYEVKEYREKRSLEANDYYWVLVTKIGNALNKSKEEVHRQMLKDYSQQSVISVGEEVDIKGFIPYYEEIGSGYVGNKRFIHYRVFKGSSELDSKEMYHLIEGVVQEAQQLDIETRTPEELAKLKHYGELLK